MKLRYILIGCALSAFFFIGCRQFEEEATKVENTPKEPELYEPSELAMLMRNMYEQNLELKAQIEKGELPESFPADFYAVHTAEATKGMVKDTATYQALARVYMENMEAITKAGTVREAKIAYNHMIMTCASCHNIYCQGPLEKIRKMKISSLDE